MALKSGYFTKIRINPVIRVAFAIPRSGDTQAVCGHELSMLVKLDNFTVLFDAGQTDVFSSNAKLDGIDLSEVDALVISHGHYDHTGGVPEFCRINRKADIYIHPDALCDRYNAGHDNQIGECISVPWNNTYKDSFGTRMTFIKGPILIHSEIMLSGEIPEEYGYEKPPFRFVKLNNSGGFEDDAVKDEQFMIIKRNRGIYLFIGCSHSGILNCVAYAKDLFPNSGIRGIIGGMHLGKCSDEQLDDIICGLKSAGVEKIIPLHCTGISATCHIKNSFSEKCLLLNSGDEIVLEK